MGFKNGLAYHLPPLNQSLVTRKASSYIGSVILTMSRRSMKITTETPVMIKGPLGPLEAILQGFDQSHVPEKVVIVCHPHPLHDGTMHNKVVHTLIRTYRDQGMPGVRFNYRGVGDSAGTYGEGVGEADDLWAVITWLLSLNSNMRIYLAGFSFGCFVASLGYKKLLEEKDITAEHLVLVAPAVENFDFSDIYPLPGDIYVIQGDKDEVVSPMAVYDWLETVNPPLVLLDMQDAGHFFHGRLGDLKTMVTEEIIKK